MRLDEFIAQLEAAGWRSQLDAQHQRITELWRAEYPGAASYLDALEETRAKLAALRAEKVSQCGHPSSLMLRSAETGKALYCELCDERKRRRDAESMEEHYKARAEKAEAEAARLQAAIEQAPHDKHCVYFEISPANWPACVWISPDCDCWKRAALAQEGEG